MCFYNCEEGYLRVLEERERVYVKSMRESVCVKSMCVCKCIEHESVYVYSMRVCMSRA